MIQIRTGKDYPANPDAHKPNQKRRERIAERLEENLREGKLPTPARSFPIGPETALPGVFEGGDGERVTHRGKKGEKGGFWGNRE